MTELYQRPQLLESRYYRMTVRTDGLRRVACFEILNTMQLPQKRPYSRQTTNTSIQELTSALPFLL